MADRDQYLRRRYGIDQADYELLLERQGGVCAVCRRPPRSLALSVDHDHGLGDGTPYAVRGLVCWNCNRALALMGDRPDWVEQLMRYLQRPPAFAVLRPRYPSAGPAPRRKRRRHSARNNARTP